jgi:DNA repair protein RadC
MSAGRMGFKDAGKPHYLGHRERLRKCFRDAGADRVKPRFI